MRMSIKWVTGALALGSVSLGLAMGGTAHAQQPATFPMTVTENRLPGGAGQATITPVGPGQIRVDIRITGLPPNDERAAHIHTAAGAQCDNGAPVTYPLTNVKADASGVGTSSTVVTVTANQPIMANNAYVNVHQGATPPGQGVICANVTASYTAQTPGAAPAAQAPAGAAAAPAAPRTGVGGGDNAAAGATGLLAVLMALTVGGGVLARARRR